MEAKSFISEKEIQDQVQNMVAENKDKIVFESGKRTKIAILLKNSSSYTEYKDHLMQFDVTLNDKQYTVIVGVK